MKRFSTTIVALVLGFAVLKADDKAPKELEGTYKAVSMNKGGVDAPDDILSTVTAKIAGNEMTFTIKGKSHPAKIKLDGTKKPAHIDLSPSDGPEKGKTFLGIYKVEKGELVIAFTEKGERPSEFKGEGDALLIRLKREEKK